MVTQGWCGHRDGEAHGDAVGSGFDGLIKFEVTGAKCDLRSEQ